jgi:error-prone DNA polymerase
MEAPVPLAPMRGGQEVVEDYRSTGLSLRCHPLAFLRDDLRARGMRPCSDLATARDGKWIAIAGMVLVRQRPGSASGVTFITIEDETSVANLIVWPSVFEQQRRVILSAGLLGCHGRVQREGEVIHVIVRKVEDLSDLLRDVEKRGSEQPLPPGQGAGIPTSTPSASSSRTEAGIQRAPDKDIPDLRLGSGIRVPTRDFR